MMVFLKKAILLTFSMLFFISICNLNGQVEVNDSIFKLKGVEFEMKIPKDWGVDKSSKADQLLAKIDSLFPPTDERKSKLFIMKHSSISNNFLTIDVTEYIQEIDGNIDKINSSRIYYTLKDLETKGYEVIDLKLNDIQIDNLSFKEGVAILTLKKDKDTFVLRVSFYYGLVKNHYVVFQLAQPIYPFPDDIVNAIKEIKFK